MVDLLLIVPHPDDEVFGAGGIFSKMAAHGKTAATLTLTRGGAGRSLGLCKQEDLPDMREKELRASLETLQVQHVHIWDYPDYLPDNTRGMEHRDGLKAVDADELSARTCALIEDIKPKAILTFPPNGGNGHPDHVVTHQVVMAALEKSPHTLEALYYYAAAKPYNVMAREGFLPLEEIAAQHLAATHYIDVRDYMAIKLAAMAKHKTQALSVLMFMENFSKRLMTESFHRAFPKHEGESVYVEWL
ncbi:MAG: PIG-L deacetylase family protein [Trueperaceae bacterium]